MKKIAKALLLVGLTVSMAVACDLGGSSSTSNVSSASSENSSTSLTSSETTSSSSVTSSNSSSSASSSQSSSSSSSSQSSSSSSSSSSSVAPKVTGITLNTDLVKKAYKYGEALDLTGLVVTANYDNNSNEAVKNYTTDPANGTVLNEVGDKTVTVTYLTFTANFSVKVEKELNGITLDTTNVKKYYRYGQTLDLTGLVVTANYSNNTTEAVTDYTTSVAVGTELKENTKIVVTYKNFTDEFTVEVDYGNLEFNHDIIEGKSYHYGDVLDLSNLNPHIEYDDGYTEALTEFTTNPASGTVLKTLGEVVIKFEAKGQEGQGWGGWFTIVVLPNAETGTKVTLDLSAAHTFENGVATEKAIGTVGSDYAPEFKLTKVSTGEASMTIVNNKTRLMAGDTIENVNSLGGVTAIRVNGGSGNFRLYAGYTQDKMYEFMSAESEGGDRIYENIPSLNYFKFVGKYDNWPADISSIEFTYTRNENHELVNGNETPIETLTVNEGEYIKGNKTLVVTANTVSVDNKTYTYTGIVYNEALLYMNDNGGLLVKYVDNTAVVVTDTVDNYSALTGRYTKVIGATEVKMFVNGKEVAANTAETRAAMGLGETFTFTATDNAVPTETPEITFVDESASGGETDAFVGTYTAKGPIYLYDAMSGDTADVIVNKVVVTKENGEYYIDYSDTADGFYPGFTGKVEAFVSKGTKLCSYATDEITIIINTETKYIELGYYDVENYTFFADGSIGYTYESANKPTATFENGTVKALAEGNFYLSAKASNGLEVKYYVHVNGYVPATITVSTGPFDLTVGDTYQINASVNEDATDKTLSFSANDKSVLSVSETGLVTALKEGSACVIVTSNDEEVWIGFNVKAATPKITVTTYTFDDENSETFTLVVTEGESATIKNGDDTYEFTFYNGKYYYDSNSNVAFEVRTSGSQSYLEIYDSGMDLFGYEGPITVYSDSIFLTFVSSEQVDAQGQSQGQQGQGGEQGQGQPADVVLNYTFYDDNYDEHTLDVIEGKSAKIDNTYNFTYKNGHYVYDEDDSVYFDVRHSGADFLDYYDDGMNFFGCGMYSVVITYATEGTLDLYEN